MGDTVYVKLNATSQSNLHSVSTLTTPESAVEAQTLMDMHSYMENESTGEHAARELTAPKNIELCFDSIEWIEEDPGGGLPFPAFTTYSFTEAGATDAKGRKFNLEGSLSMKWYKVARPCADRPY